MAGLDKIIERIKNDTEAQCQAVSQQADENISLIYEKAEKEAAEKAKSIMAAAEREVKIISEKAESGSRQRASQIILAAKSEAINEIIDCALKTMGNMSDEEYFSAVYSLAVKYAGKSKEGVIHFNEADLKRLPENFESTLRSAGCDISVSRVPDNNIDSGFVLSFGSIEENCTFSALIDEKLDVIKEKIYQIIFQ